MAAAGELIEFKAVVLESIFNAGSVNDKGSFALLREVGNVIRGDGILFGYKRRDVYEQNRRRKKKE